MTLKIKFAVIISLCFLLCACVKQASYNFQGGYIPPSFKTDGHTFNFKPDTAHKNALQKKWNQVRDAEKQDPTFTGRILNMNDPVLIKEWAELYDFLINVDIPTRLRYVNSFFNRFTFKDDDTNWGEAYWATPREFLTKDGGDCEDYAIAKYYALKELGVSAERMFLTVVGYHDKKGLHAILVVFEGNDYYVLDNLKKDTVYLNSTDKAFCPKQYYNEKMSKFHNY